MSELRVTIERINKLESHPNADRLDLATVLGWQCVVQKDLYEEGDLIVYFPIDVILTEELEAAIFGTDSKIKLKKSRIKTIKLRGAFSQGLVVPLGVVKSFIPDLIEKEGKNIAKELGVKKFEPKTPGNMRTTGGQQKKKKDINSNFKKYTSINHLKNYPKALEGEKVVITEKIHGCLQANTKITLANGEKKSIKEIVDNKLDVEILGMDKDENIVPTKITNWYNNGISQDWLKIKATRNKLGKGHWYRTVLCTSNHEFYCPDIKKYIPASDLKISDKILMKRETLVLSYTQEQILIGKMLGDGSLQVNSVVFGHKKEHEQYVDYTLECLNELAGNKQKDQESGYGTLMCRARTKSNPAITSLFSNWFFDKNKTVPFGIELAPISLAFWYMDDGSLTHHESQEDRISLATCGFDATSNFNLVQSLKKLNINAKKYKEGDYYRIKINADNADKFFVLIAPYVCDCMQYKLPERYRGQNQIKLKDYSTYKLDKKEQTVIGIEKISTTKINKTRYDLETETHNFFANDMLVHNSNFRCGYVPISGGFFTRTWKRIKALFSGGQKYRGYEFVFGSHNVQLSNKFKKTFYTDKMVEKNVYYQAVEKYNLKDKLALGDVLYGEIYGAGIQENYNYGLKDEIKLIVFDIMSHGKYLSCGVAKTICSNKGLDFVPIIEEAMFSSELVEKHVSGPSLLSPTQKIREGIVVKPVVEKSSYMGRMVFKFINPAYLLKDNTEYH